MKLECIGGPFGDCTYNYVVKDYRSKTIGEFCKELIQYCKDNDIHTADARLVMSKTAFPDRQLFDILSGELHYVATTAYDDMQISSITANGSYGMFSFFIQPAVSDMTSLLQMTYNIKQTYKRMNRIKELNQTVDMMNSADYKERFKAEYAQVNIRLTKLKQMCQKWDDDKLDFTPTCPRETYRMQIEAMQNYRDILVIRAKIEGIDISEL
jgi:hypothetical protein